MARITLPWHGSITDLATDLAALLTREQGEKLAHELTRFLTLPHLADKFRMLTGAVCPRCGGDGDQLSEVSLTGSARCGSCRGSGRVPDDGSASPWVNEQLAKSGLLRTP